MNNDLRLSITLVYPNPNQPRKQFDPGKLEELAASIKEYGILEPIVVTKRGDRFMIIGGERRYRASLLAGLSVIPVRVIDADDELVEELSLLENIQRQDLNPIEEAKAFQALLDRGWTKKQLADKMGFKQLWRVDERTSLLNLSPEYQKLVIEGAIGHSQAFEMSRVPPNQQSLIFRKLQSGQLASYNKLRSFVSALIIASNQSTIFAFQSATPEEKKSIDDFSSLMSSVERLIRATMATNTDHLKKVVFHSDVTPERIDFVIQNLMKLRKIIMTGAGVKDVLAA